MGGVTDRTLCSSYTIGEYVISLPYDWVRYVEFRNGRKLSVVEIILTPIRGDQERDLLSVSINSDTSSMSRPGGFDISRPITREDVRRLNLSGPLVGKDSKGRYIEVYLRKVYRIKSGARLVVLPKDCVRWWQRTANKELYRVRVFAVDMTLEVMPLFDNLPRRRRRPPKRANERDS